jgi:hypothetical protein
MVWRLKRGLPSGFERKLALKYIYFDLRKGKALNRLKGGMYSDKAEYWPFGLASI